jgi:hypothetical protein
MGLVGIALGFASSCGVHSPSLSETKESYQSLTWHFQCPTEPRVIGPGTPDHPVIVDEGPHRFLREKLVRTPVTIKGRVCPPRRMQRDLIFAIDVSGSMYSNDNIVDDSQDDDIPPTCGRLNALKLVLDQVDFSLSNVGIVTWDDNAEETSSRMFNSADDLINDLTGNDPDSLVDIICLNSGGTSYSNAFQAAANLFQTAGREFATKELFFLSDGGPTDSSFTPPYDSQSVAAAAADRLKNVGVVVNGRTRLVTIASIMLGADANGDRFLNDRIASRNVDGTPIHAQADHANDLAQILADQASHNNIEGSTLVLGANGTSPDTIDLMPITNNFEFTIPAQRLNISGNGQDFGVKFEYWDTHMNRHTANGQLLWMD